MRDMCCSTGRSEPRSPTTGPLWARKIAISKSTLSKIERGKYNSGLSIATLLNIADGLKVELYSLLLCTQEELRVLRAQAEREKTKR